MYQIIDAHSHIYPDKIAQKASCTIGKFYDLNMENNGTVQRLLDIGKKAGVSQFVVHSCATTVSQVHTINEFILSQMQLHSQLIGFITLHPDMTKIEVEKEIAWGIENGFKGIKLHPDFQKFYIDDAKLDTIYALASNTLPILFHTGDKRFEYSRPHRLAKVAKQYPNLTAIAAHFGGYSCWEQIDCYNNLDNIYMDTSSSLAFLSPQQAENIIANFGAERFFFGVDYPMWSHDEELERFFKLHLSEQQRKLILAENIKKLLNLA